MAATKVHLRKPITVIELPSDDEVEDAVERGDDTPLDRYIADHGPVLALPRKQWRKDLLELLKWVDACSRDDERDAMLKWMAKMQMK